MKLGISSKNKSIFWKIILRIVGSWALGRGPWALAHALIMADLNNALIMANLNQKLIMADLNQHFDVQTIKINYALSKNNAKLIQINLKLIKHHLN